MIRNVNIPAAYAAKHADEKSHARHVPVEVIAIAYFVILLLAGVLLVWQPAKIAQMNERISQLESTLQDLKLRNEDLKKAVAARESLQYVEFEARNRLGMVDPNQVQTIRVPPENSSGIGYVASVPTKQSQGRSGIFGIIDRIAQIFGAREVTAKGKK